MIDYASISAALAQTFSLECFLSILIGTLFGTVIGALPGLGPIVGITMVLPFTYAMGPLAAIGLLLGLYCGSVYGGSLSAILINTPGTPNSAATCFDGYPLAKRGLAGQALGWATVGSVFGGLFSTLILIIAGPQLAKFALRFGPIETFALISLALTCIATVSRGSTVAGIMTGLIGLFLASVGPDPLDGDIRFSFDIFQLSAGFGLIPVVVGIFALSEVFTRAGEAAGQVTATVSYSGMVFPKISELFAKGRVLQMFKSAVIGTGVGILPGTGAATAAFISYAEAKRTSPRGANFGDGEPDGILASEIANNAVTGGALVPSLALGLPGDAVTAVMLATLVLHGITPGVRLMVDNPVAVYSSFMSLTVANVAMFFFGILVAKLFAYILKVPEVLLMGLVVILCLLGTYGVRSNIFDVYLTLGAGFLGYILRMIGAPLAPLVIGLVLGQQFELSLRQGLVVTGDSFTLFFVGHPIALVLFITTALVLGIPFIKYLMNRGRIDVDGAGDLPD
ncbi:tripartite tricarboxylate transporter permease [Desulfovibrio sp. OttesenSCG-928-O18]|nr:tripartite tricarboxylate transporter permease [Desulfovibrio sp. OttesenSCG-928-O18]